MKMRFLFCLLIVSLMSLDAIADAWVQHNGACNWFTKRYKAHVGIKKAGQIGNECSHTTSDCYHVEEECLHQTCQDFFCVTWARAYARINDQGSETYEYGGFDGSNQWYAGSDMTFKVPAQNFAPMVFQKGEKNRFGESKCSVGQVIFDRRTHSIRLLNIMGFINIKTDDPVNDFAAMVLSVTKKTNDDDLDDAIYMKNLVWDTRLMINNGRLKIKGAMAKEKITAKFEQDITNASFQLNELIIPIPAYLNPDDLAFNIGVDNGNLGYGISDKFTVEDTDTIIPIANLPANPEQLSFKNFPNPITGRYTNVEFELPESQWVDLYLCDINGNPIKTLFMGQVNAKETKQIKNVDLDEINGIVGYLKLITDKKVVVRKIVKIN